jgi:membrane protease YdiL (CAAX protease family)
MQPISRDLPSTHSLDDESDSCSFNFPEKSIFSFATGVGLYKISHELIKFAADVGYDQCPTLPKPFYAYAQSIGSSVNSIPVFTNTFNTIFFKGPIIEELIFRIGIQDTYLKKIPKAILKRIAPSYVNSLDTKIAKVTRIVFSALAFSLSHATAPEFEWPVCSTAKLVNTFVMGLILGGIQEFTEEPWMNMLVHSGFNLIPALILENRGLSFQQR